jgi:N-acetylglucosamine-6-phosphate deacetylase
MTLRRHHSYSIKSQILPSLVPREYQDGSSLLGAHAEGPYLQPSKKGAHNSSLFQHPSSSSPKDIYGSSNLPIIKLVTLAPELPESEKLIRDLTGRGLVVSMGHSAATYEEGIKGLEAGATALTHLMNAMTPLHHRNPGLAGLITLPGLVVPHYSMIPDGCHVHPRILTLLHRANPSKSILITDSIELAGLEDGIYPGHAQISFNQEKKGDYVTIEGTDTLIGSCISLQKCVRNLMEWSGCGIAEAVRCVTENVVSLMGVDDRGVLEPGKRADFVVLDDDGFVTQTWIAGKKVWETGK